MSNITGRAGNVQWRFREPISDFTKPKISYAFFCYNVIKERGEDFVRESLESIKGQSDDIMVIDQDSEDNIKQLTKEVGFKYYNVPKRKDTFCHLSRMTNKAIIEAKYDIFLRLTPDIVYPNNMSYFITSFFRQHDPRKIYLMIKCFYQYDGKIYGHKQNQSKQGSLKQYWRPYLLKARGWDERTSFYNGEDMYANRLLQVVFRCTPRIPRDYFLVHRDHPIMVNERTRSEFIAKSEFKWQRQLKLMSYNLRKYKELVVNSYF